MQKAIGELLLNDYSRRGFLDGVGLRLPSICVRPGAPNKAASGLFSNIIREPLVGLEAILPATKDVKMFLLRHALQLVSRYMPQLWIPPYLVTDVRS